MNECTAYRRGRAGFWLVALAAPLVFPTQPALGEPTSYARPPLTVAPIAGVLAGDPSTTYLIGAGGRLGVELPAVRWVRPIVSISSVVYPAVGARLGAGYLTAGARYGAVRYLQLGIGVGVVREQLRLRLDDRRVDESVTSFGVPLSVGVGWLIFNRIDLGLSYHHVFLVGGGSSWIGHPLASIGYRL